MNPILREVQTEVKSVEGRVVARLRAAGVIFTGKEEWVKQLVKSELGIRIQLKWVIVSCVASGLLGAVVVALVR